MKLLIIVAVLFLFGCGLGADGNIPPNNPDSEWEFDENGHVVEIEPKMAVSQTFIGEENANQD